MSQTKNEAHPSSSFGLPRSHVRVDKLEFQSFAEPNDVAYVVDNIELLIINNYDE